MNIRYAPFGLWWVDDVTLNAGSGGDTIAADDISGTKYQRVKLVEGADGTNDGDISASNPLPVDLYNKNLISTNNSTTTPLANDATFTGTGDDCDGYTAVVCTLDSSHDSATDGMTFEFSTDNSNWDDTYTFTYAAADGARRFQFPVTARYFRIVYTNGGTTQTTFRVQTILHRQNTLTSIHRLVDATDPDRSAQLMKSAVIAQVNGSGDFVPVQASATGIMKTSASSQGTVAHGVGDADEPVKVGMKAIAHGTNPTEVDAADVTDWYANLAGVPFTIGGHPNVVTSTVTIDDADGPQTSADIASITEKAVVTRVSVLADNANTADVRVIVGFGAFSTPSTTAATKVLLEHMGVPPGGGVTIGDGSGILGVGGTGENIEYTCEDPVGGSVSISVSYYEISS